jgi:hypothetical protein
VVEQSTVNRLVAGSNPAWGVVTSKIIKNCGGASHCHGFWFLIEKYRLYQLDLLELLARLRRANNSKFFLGILLTPQSLSVTDEL